MPIRTHRITLPLIAPDTRHCQDWRTCVQCVPSPKKNRTPIFRNIDSKYFTTSLSTGIGCGTRISNDSIHSDGGFIDDVIQGSELSDVGFLDGIDTDQDEYLNSITQENDNFGYDNCTATCVPGFIFRTDILKKNRDRELNRELNRDLIDMEECNGGDRRHNSNNLTFIRL